MSENYRNLSELFWIFFRILEDKVSMKRNHRTQSTNQAAVCIPLGGAKSDTENIRKALPRL